MRRRLLPQALRCRRSSAPMRCPLIKRKLPSQTGRVWLACHRLDTRPRTEWRAGSRRTRSEIGRDRRAADGRIIINGADRTDREVIADLIGLAPGDMLTTNRLARASRRLAELPIASDIRLQYRPGERGTADLSIDVEEKSLFPEWWEGWAVVVGEAIFKDGVTIDIAGPLAGAKSGRSERGGSASVLACNLASRFQPARCRVSRGSRGCGNDRPYRVGSAATGPLLEEKERSLGVSLADWANPALRWEAGTAFTQFDERSFVALQGALQRRLLQERLALMLNVGQFLPVNGSSAFFVGDVSADWQSRVPTGRAVPFWSAWVGYTATTAAAPLAKWPGASTGKGRNATLRAHKLLEQNVVTGEVFGRRLFYASAEYERPVYRHEMGTLGFAVFVDSARAWQRLDSPLPLRCMWTSALASGCARQDSAAPSEWTTPGDCATGRRQCRQPDRGMAEALRVRQRNHLRA